MTRATAHGRVEPATTPPVPDRDTTGGPDEREHDDENRWKNWAAVGLLALAICTALVVAGRGDLVDLDVYRRAGERWLAERDPYATRGELPFTYPPFAVVLATGAAIAPAAAVVVLGVFTAGVAAAGAAVSWTTPVASRSGTTRKGHRRAVRRRKASARALGLPVVLAIAIASEPVLRSLHLGQVNGLVAGLVLCDLLVVPQRRRGWLTGLAAGIKLTPLIFLLHLALRREGGAIVRVWLAFGLTVVAGAAALPTSTLAFWSDLVLEPDRVGDPGFADNQSLLGAATRFIPSWSVTAWVVGSLLVVSMAVVVQHRHRHGPPTLGVIATALTGLLISPISWSHHWLLLPAAGVLCWRLDQRVTAIGVLAASLGASLSTLVNDGPAPTSVWAEAPSSAITVAGLASLLALMRAPALQERHRDVPEEVAQPQRHARRLLPSTHGHELATPRAETGRPRSAPDRLDLPATRDLDATVPVRSTPALSPRGPGWP